MPRRLGQVRLVIQPRYRPKSRLCAPSRQADHILRWLGPGQKLLHLHPRHTCERVSMTGIRTRLWSWIHLQLTPRIHCMRWTLKVTDLKLDTPEDGTPPPARLELYTQNVCSLGTFIADHSMRSIESWSPLS
jgi:hypothetical protein